MTHEKYEKAVELNAEMNYLAELECLLENACSDRFLAAISNCKYEDARCIIITECKVLNHIALGDNIRARLLDVVREEYDKLKEIFKAL